MITIKVDSSATYPVKMSWESFTLEMSWEEWDRIREEIEKTRWDEQISRMMAELRAWDEEYAK